MGLRARVKDRVKRLLSGETPAASPPSPAASPPPQAAAAPPAAAAPRPATAPPPRPATAPPPGPAAAPADGDSPATIDAEKKRQARLKAKKAVLQFLVKQGGEAAMKDMHDFSERRYFVAHKAFSDLMEEYIGEELILFDQDTYRATITAGGRRWIEEATDIQTREKP